MRWYVDGLCRFLLACGIVTLGLTGQAGAVIVTLEASQDNTLYENSEGALSNGVGQHVFAGRNGAGGGQLRMRGLIMFDVASRIPPGATINSIELGLHASTPMSHAGTVALHPVLSPWGEGLSNATMGEAGGAMSTTDDATWIHTYFNTLFWNTPGGDFRPEASANLAVATNGPQVIGSTPELVADVQGWLDDPGSNNGWLLRQVDEAALAIRFDSRDHADPSVRPRLTVDFSLPPLLISPPSGIFALTQVMDVVLFVNLPPERTITGAMAFLDDVDVSADYGLCFLSSTGTLTEGGQTFRCPNRSAAAIGAGPHTLRVVLNLDDGTFLEQAVNWIILPNTEP